MCQQNPRDCFWQQKRVDEDVPTFTLDMFAPNRNSHALSS